MRPQIDFFDVLSATGEVGISFLFLLRVFLSASSSYLVSPPPSIVNHRVDTLPR